MAARDPDVTSASSSTIPPVLTEPAWTTPGHGATPSGQRFHFSATVHILLLLIFAGMGLGFGALTWSGVEEWWRAPSAPQPVTTAAALAIPATDDYAWITLTDAVWDCAHAPIKASGSYAYGVVQGPQGQRLVVAVPQVEDIPCPPNLQRPAATLTGRLEQRAPGAALPAPVQWNDLTNDHPSSPAWIVWTDWSPARGFSAAASLLFFALLSMFGCMIFAFSLAAFIADLRAQRQPRRPRLANLTFRLPLSTGASALGIFGVSMGGLQVVAFGGLFFLKWLPNVVGLAVGVLAGLWVLATLGAYIEGWKRRASDLWLGPTGCAIRGGPLHGTQHTWAEHGQPTPDFCHIVQHGAPDNEASEAFADRSTLIIRGEVVAISQDQAEDRSLQALADTLAGVGRTPAMSSDGRPHLAVVLCPGCGAPVPPRSRSTCRFCGQSVDMPAAIHKQLAAHADHERDRAESERLLRRVLRQPSAARVNALLLVLLPPLLLSWPVAGAVFDEFYQRNIFHAYHGLALAVAALCGNLALQFLLRSQVEARAAMRIIATHFAARPPRQSGATPDCRICGGPLAVDADKLLVLCGYCGSENVTGLNLLPVAAEQADQLGGLREAVVSRLRVQRRWRVRSLAALGLLLLCALALWPVRNTLRQAKQQATMSTVDKR